LVQRAALELEAGALQLRQHRESTVAQHEPKCVLAALKMQRIDRA
jgi:hypothetical protein